MKIHVLVNPRNPTGLANRVDPFAVHGYKYIKHLSPHFEMVHYGIPGAQVDCEHVDIPTTPTEIQRFNGIAGEEIRKRANPGDLIACFFGVDNKLACDMNPTCKVVEPSIGYRANGIFAPYRVFTSYANMHMFYGERGMLMNPSWFDEVIGNPFTVSEFEYSEEKEDYFLYFGRVCEEKGVHLAIQATEKAGKKLIIAGPGSLKTLGLIEANLSGTPIITTDWGAFPEIVLEGQTGYRVRDFKSLLNAINNIDKINAFECREWGLNFSDEIIHDKHKNYLNKVIANDFYA